MFTSTLKVSTAPSGVVILSRATIFESTSSHCLLPFGSVRMERALDLFPTANSPPGTTFQVEVNMVFQRGGRAKLTFWYEPGWGYSVRMMRELRIQNNSLDIFIREVTARSRAG